MGPTDNGRPQVLKLVSYIYIYVQRTYGIWRTPRRKQVRQARPWKRADPHQPGDQNRHFGRQKARLYTYM